MYLISRYREVILEESMQHMQAIISALKEYELLVPALIKGMFETLQKAFLVSLEQGRVHKIVKR